MTDVNPHQKFIEYQAEILNALASGENPQKVAASARNIIKSLYGYPVPKGAELGISVNDVCNLECKHCYYASTHNKALERRDGLLNSRDWREIIDSALGEGFRHFPIIGKEPLLSPEITYTIFSALEDRKKEFPEINYELITNGTLIKENITWLKRLSFSFLSISFDGYEEEHDKVRGLGSYQRSREGLQHLRDSDVKNLTVSHTVMPHNVYSLDKMILDLTDAGAEYFSIGFCFPTKYNDQKLTIYSEIKLFDEVIKQLQNAPSGIDISVNIPAEEQAELLAQLYKRGDIQKERLAVTEDISPVLVMPVSCSPRTAIQLNFLPTMFYSGFRVDCTGAALDFCVDLQNPETRNGFGNVKNQSIRTLWNKAKDFMWKPYTEKYYQRLASVFKAESVSPILTQWYNL